ncbi:hypothetical protein M1B35_09295 [Pseudomonas sp. MAFF 302046]|uniref:MarR family transcriptional regulator n=1 Tax=Pseudomonas morbosilactucae TaxID=2938197 RepID=A0ABT0JEK5_9PSED|nr:hypothetical protein [Pseudomonas morbosilactucae]MCK9814320.1 hypothetical protein [Pseudomonas morbosilactucae]
MLDRMNADVGTVEISASAWGELSHLERHLIEFYRRLSKRDQDHLRKLTEALGAHPEQFEDD